MIQTSSFSRLLILAFFYLLTLGIFTAKGTNLKILKLKKNNNMINNISVTFLPVAYICTSHFYPISLFLVSNNPYHIVITFVYCKILMNIK